MKKLLLFALVMGLGTMSFAQNANISVDAIIQPSGTIITEDPANGTTAIEVTITNNDAAYTFVANQTTFNFNVTIDGDFVQNPTPPVSNEFLIPILADLAPGASVNIFLATAWGPVAEPGTHEVCIELVRAVITSAPFVLTNMDQNKQFCQDFLFAWPLGINDFVVSEISNIKTDGEVMTISVTNNSNQAKIQLMSVTGQVLKTVVTSASGQNFTQEINISDLTSGVYIVTIQNENGASVAQKVFIQ